MPTPILTIRIIVAYLLLTNLAVLPFIFSHIGNTPKPAITILGYAVFVTVQVMALAAQGRRQRAALVVLLVGAAAWLGTTVYVMANIDWVRSAHFTRWDSFGWMLHRFLEPGSGFKAMEIVGHVYGTPIWLGPVEALILYAICVWLNADRARATSNSPLV